MPRHAHTVERTFWAGHRWASPSFLASTSSGAHLRLSANLISETPRKRTDRRRFADWPRVGDPPGSTSATRPADRPTPSPVVRIVREPRELRPTRTGADASVDGDSAYDRDRADDVV